MNIDAIGQAAVWYPDGDLDILDNVNFTFNADNLPDLGFCDISFDSVYRYGYRCKIYFYKDVSSPFIRRDYYDSPEGINNQ